MSFPTPDNRKWYRKKRNAARIGAAAIWLAGSAAIAAAYSADERLVLWTQLGIGCAALLFFSFLTPYVVRLAKRRRYPKGYNLLFAAVFASMLLYIAVLLGGTVLDIAQGPVTTKATVADRWDPRRGGDQVRFADGSTYEVFKEYVRLEKGHTYTVKLFKHSKIAIGIERIDVNNR
ncbi:hypothetical protein [Paenibacillus sp. GYB003]|uniref:hypothetical protein n=1 Tax=Paenibacillus sp. GYB003 TaxID=2994392 RepID=UPI002F968260